jgi:hypothetical protein
MFFFLKSVSVLAILQIYFLKRLFRILVNLGLKLFPRRALFCGVFGVALAKAAFSLYKIARYWTEFKTLFLLVK